MFPTKHNEILSLIDKIDPLKYCSTRNYIDGAVTKLSPYISRGVISTNQIWKAVVAKGYDRNQIQLLLKELCWRDYFQQVWMAKDNEIDTDLKSIQLKVNHHNLSSAIAKGNTTIKAIDEAIKTLEQTGYMHNHLRMYLASISCNIAQNHWHTPAKWMYYYLLDADWASNALSWQWVAGSFSSKKYYANQENINKFCYTNQTKTFLDVSYNDIENIEIPSILEPNEAFILETKLPINNPLIIDKNIPTAIYNFYNLDCNWLSDIKANRVLLLEPSFFKKYPVCEQTIEFVLNLAKNIDNVKIFVGEFTELQILLDQSTTYYKEHPTNKHYTGVEHKREWLFEKVNGYYPSFTGYWKQCEKYL